MNEQTLNFEFEKNRQSIKGFPELRWTGKRPYTSTQYYPAQLKERHGDQSGNWINKIFWGDNLQVMSHLLKEFRGEIDLIYIDPPFDSKADYKKKIELKGVGTATSDSSSFEEKQYGDIWTNDEYLQFMYERLIILRELLSDKGSIYLHCDWHKSHHLRCLMDEIFGQQNFRNEIIWSFGGKGLVNAKKNFVRNYNSILFYTKSDEVLLNLRSGIISKSILQRFGKYLSEDGIIYFKALRNSGDVLELEKATKTFIKNNNREPLDDDIARDYSNGSLLKDVWDIPIVRQNDAYDEYVNYPTQKPEALLERIIKASTNPGDLVFDCFMGSGTTQAVAMKLGRRFIGADINLGAIQTTTKRLLGIQNELKDGASKFSGFEVYNVNNYDFFRNPLQAKSLLIEALEIQPFLQDNLWDGEKDGRMVKIMPVNRIATKADLESLKANMPYKTYEKRKEENPAEPVERITIVCMGHESDLKAFFLQELSQYKFDIQIVDILKDKTDLQLKREAEADVVREGDKLVIRNFYPLNLMQKLSLQKEFVSDWRVLVESVMIDFNFDGAIMQPSITDVPDKKSIVAGVYDIPENAGTIRIKITDVLSESLEVEV